jgi:hypothetical protein
MWRLRVFLWLLTAGRHSLHIYGTAARASRGILLDSGMQHETRVCFMQDMKRQLSQRQADITGNACLDDKFTACWPERTEVEN